MLTLLENIMNETELFDPHSNQWLLNKFKTYNILRSSDTAYYSKKYRMHIITRYSDVKYALSEHDIFSSSRGNLIVEEQFRFNNTLGASDNPTHDIYKNIVKNAYSKDNITRILESFSYKAKELLSEKQSFNISAIIEELSAWVTTEILNIPYDKEKIKNLIVDIQKYSPMAVSVNINDQSYKEFKEIIESLVSAKVTPLGPGIYKEFIENHPNINPVMSLFHGPTISGASSLTGALEFITLDLYRENQLSNLLNDRSLIPAAVNESLRFHASTGRFSRTVIKDVTLHGVDLKSGNRVALCLESANRDPDKFVEPDKFNLNRDTTGQLAFGHGLHACIALAITKAVMTRYLELLLDTVGQYRVTTPTSDLTYIMTASGNDDMINNLYIEKE